LAAISYVCSVSLQEICIYKICKSVYLGMASMFILIANQGAGNDLADNR
jgi:hypothetical protein